MKASISIILASSIVITLIPTANAEWVNGYQKSNGAYVQSYNRTTRNNTNVDNYSYNPRTDTPKYYSSPSYSSPSYSVPSYSSPARSNPSRRPIGSDIYIPPNLSNQF